MVVIATTNMHTINMLLTISSAIRLVSLKKKIDVHVELNSGCTGQVWLFSYHFFKHLQ